MSTLEGRSKSASPPRSGRPPRTSAESAGATRIRWYRRPREAGIIEAGSIRDLHRRATGRSGLRRLALAAVAIAAATCAAPASATIFDIGEPEKVGTFKVQGGHFNQTVNYFANYKFDSADRCWTYTYRDQGGSSFRLNFDPGERDRWKWNGSDLPMALSVSGGATRKWSGTVESKPLKEDRDGCGGATPLRDNGRACGAAELHGVFTGFSLIPTKGRKYSPRGDDATPFGPVLDRDPFRAHNTANCPSDSVHGLLAIPAASENGMRKLDKAKIGDELTLRGDADESGPGPDGFTTIGDWITGTHVDAWVNWKLKLKRVRPHR